jgi:hypothetical protein
MNTRDERFIHAAEEEAKHPIAVGNPYGFLSAQDAAFLQAAIEEGGRCISAGAYRRGVEEVGQQLQQAIEAAKAEEIAVIEG